MARRGRQLVGGEIAPGVEQARAPGHAAGIGISVAFGPAHSERDDATVLTSRAATLGPLNRYAPHPMAAPASRRHIVLCTLEPLGVRTLEELNRLGERVVVIAENVEARHREVATGLGARIIDGSPRDPECLRDADVEHARAIVLTADDDTGNIHAALLAQSQSPGIHIVLRTFDDEFARRVESLFPDAVAMSASALAAPGFLTAVLDPEADERWIDILGRTLAFRHAEPDDPAVVVALADDSVTPIRLFPREGQHLLSLVDPSGGPAHVKSTKPAGRTMPLPRVRSVGWLRRVDRRFWVLLAVLVAITLLSMLVFVMSAPLGLVDALYNAVNAFFGGVPDQAAQNTAGLRIFVILLTLFGAAALAMFYGLIADVVLSARISNLLGPQPTEARNHIIVVGLGSIGYRIALLLRQRGIPVVAAEKDLGGRFVDSARNQRIPVVGPDARTPQGLKKLGIEHARGLLAVTDDDATNMATAMHARGARPDLRIVLRLFDPDLAAQLDKALGDYNSRSVSALAAPAFAAAAVGREILASIPLSARQVLLVARVTVEPGSAADGSTVESEERAGTSAASGECRVLALVVGDQVRWSPGPAETVLAGTEMVIVATRRGVSAAVARGARRSGAADPSRSAELADHEEMREPEGVEGRALGRVDGPTKDPAESGVAGAEVVEAGVDDPVMHDAHRQPAEQ
jgi:Trk K+ transport system NAD-binding subunit